MATPEERELIKEGCARGFQEEMTNIFRVLFTVNVSNPGDESEALNRARKGMELGLKTLRECVKLADTLP